MLANGPLWQRMMNYLVFSFVAAKNKALKLPSEVVVPKLIALNSILLISWSLLASQDGCCENCTDQVRAATLIEAENSLWPFVLS